MKNRYISLWSTPLFLCVISVTVMVCSAFSQDKQYPIPVTENIEQTSPGSAMFLNYPKYFKRGDGKLTEINTNIVSSNDPNWDYQVTTGIWYLYIRKDGYFQAQHEGDVFTYRFSGLGYGNGQSFRSVDLGQPFFGQMEVNGDTIIWYDVLPEVNLSVRYIHDILKVDVILQGTFMNDLRLVAADGNVNPEDMLTARFDIDLVEINSEPRQNGVFRDLYSEAVYVDKPLTFVRDGRTLHKLRLAESYAIDQNGERIHEIYDENGEFVRDILPVKTTQRWQLQRGTLGLAEISAHIGDLIALPEGEVVIDPSTQFNYGNGSLKDARLENGSSSDLGGQTTILMNYNDHSVLAVNISSLGDIEINDAKLNFYIEDNDLDSNENIKAYKVNTDWEEGTVDWFDPWTSDGGDYSTPGAILDVDDIVTGWF